jgi:hypothetical protein
MAPPNHRVPIDVSWRNLFPLLTVRGGDDVNGKPSLLFYSRRYGEPYSDYPMELVPPSWMDPMWFVALARKQPEVRELLDKSFKANNADHSRKKLISLLQRVYQEQYLPKILALFEGAAPYLAEWLLCNHAYRITDEAHRETMAREHKKSRVEKSNSTAATAKT